jgi:hypothetical protein
MRTPCRPVWVGVAAAVLLCALGCNTMDNYTANRLSDLTDVAHVDLTVLALGIVANVGPMTLGGESVAGYDGQAWQLRIGLGGPQVVGMLGEAAGLFWTFDRFEVNRRKYGPFDSGWLGDEDAYWARQPAWGSIGISAGLMFGVGAQFDFVELADFVLGFFGHDITHDDLRPKLPLDPEAAAREAAARAYLEGAAAAHRAEIEARSKRKENE